MPNGSLCARCGAKLARLGGDQTCPVCLVADAVGFAGGPEAADEAGGEGGGAGPGDGRNGAARREVGDYELLEKVDSGGMGVVYKARQISLNRIVAVKMILAGVWATPSAVARFRAEAEAAARLRHPNIVGIHEVGEHDGQHYFSMEYVDGVDLARRVRQGPLTPEKSARYLACIARAIQHAHDSGILHRDLKPSNILLDADDAPRITDFGLAKQLDADPGMTRSGQIVGTPGYMSPEQAKGDVRAQGRTADIYSLGAILYHLLTGRAPFAAATLQETLTQVMETEPVSPRLINPAVPRDLETLCLKCLEKDPRRRYPSAAELADDLDRWLRHEPIRARPASSIEKAIKWVRRKPAWAALSAAVTTALVAIAVIILLKNAQLRVSERETLANRYAGDMYYVSKAVEDGNVGAAAVLLEAQTPAGKDDDDRRGFEWRHFRWRIRDTSLRVLHQHHAPVTAVAFSPDGRWLASADEAGEVALWDVTGPRPAQWHLADETPAGLVTAGVRSNGVHSIAFSPDGVFLAVARESGAVSLWDTRERRWIPIEATGTGVAFGGTNALLAIAGGQDVRRGRAGSVTFHDWREKRTVSVAERAGAIAASRAGTFVSAGYGGRVTRWTDGLGIGQEWRAEKGVSLVAVSANAAVVATASHFDRNVRLWDAARRAPIGELKGHAGAVTGIAFAPGGLQVVTTSEDGTVRFWDASPVEVADVDGAHVGRELARYYGHSNEVTSVAYSTNGSFIATGGRDRTVRIWSGRAVKDMTTRSNVAPPLVFAPASGWLAARDRAGGLLFGSRLFGLRAPRSPVADAVPIAFGGDGRHLTLVRREAPGGPVVLEQRSTNRLEMLQTVVLAESERAARDFNAFGTTEWLILNDDAGRAGVWETGTGRRLAWIDGWPSGPVHPALSPDGRRMAVPGLIGTTNAIRVYSMPGGVLQTVLSLPGGAEAVVRDLVFSAAGSGLISCGDDRLLRFLDAASGEVRAILRRPGEPVVRLAISPDGRTLATAARDGMVQLWSVGTRREMCVLERGGGVGTGEPVALAFTPGGTALCLIDDAGRFRWWKAGDE